MTDGISTSGSKTDLNSLLGLPTVQHAASAVVTPGADSPPEGEGVSVAGVMLLTAISVSIAITGVFALALFAIASWWIIIHIPVPPVVTHVLFKLGLG